MGSFHDPENKSEEELYRKFIKDHETRLCSVGIPKCKWRTLCRKLTYSIFDAGESFMYAQDPYEDSPNELNTSLQLRLHVYSDYDMSPEDEESIYIIDHAWTYTMETARSILVTNPSLVSRMSALMELNNEENLIETILNKMWLHSHSYVVNSSDGISPSVTCWYIVDEFGSRIHYGEEPNFHLVPFYFAGDQSMYSVLFPKTEISAGDEAIIAYPGYEESLPDDMKKALKFPWNRCDFSNTDFSLLEPSIDYFASGRYEDILPDEDRFSDSALEVPSGQKFKVYSEYSDIAEFLTSPSFEVVDVKEEADIFWLAQRQYNIREIVETFPNFRFLSQFPSEHVLINKDLLAVICRRCAKYSFDCDTLESNPEWLPTTFNLKTELHKFISYFQNRQSRNLDNVWICKPFNLARGMDIHVTDNVNKIIRLSTTRSMVACKYITDAVLFPVEEKGLVKMDLRYIVLLRNTDPLEVYVYDRFWIRFANKPFELNDFTDYEKHFTVMNYSNFPLQQMYCQDFIRRFEDHYMSYKWSDIQNSINIMIKDIFTAATMKEAPAGIGRFSGSRAMYGLDIMLRWDRSHDVPRIVPMILEVNWMPDCKRACQYYPEYYNDVFSVLFLGDTRDKHVVKL